MSTPRRHLARSYQAGRTRIRQLNHARPAPRETAAHPRNPTQANARLPDHFPTNANRGDSPRPPCEPMPIPLKPSAGKHPPQITTPSATTARNCEPYPHPGGAVAAASSHFTRPIKHSNNTIISPPKQPTYDNNTFIVPTLPLSRRDN